MKYLFAIIISKEQIKSSIIYKILYYKFIKKFIDQMNKKPVKTSLTYEEKPRNYYH